MKNLNKQTNPTQPLPQHTTPFESQMVKQFFFRQPWHTKYSEKLIKYEIIELKNNEDVFKVLAKSNYGKCFCPI